MSPWRPDALLAGFESVEFSFPEDYDGAVVSTLVRLPAGAAQSLLVGGLVVIALGTLVVRFCVTAVKTLARFRARSS